MRQLFDIAGISVRINNDNLFPEYIKQSPLYSFEKVKTFYTAKWVDTLIYNNDSKIYQSTLNQIELQELESAFFTGVIKYPVQYFEHRAKVFGLGMISLGFKHYAFITDEKKAVELGIDYKSENILKKSVVHYLGAFPKTLTTNLVSFLLIIVYLWHILRNKSSKTPEFTILKYVTFLCIIHYAAIFFTAMASDHRYYYIVRILSLFSLPIYLKMIFHKKNSAIT